MKIKELQPRMPVTVAKSEGLEAACKLLADEDIGALVVYTSHGVAGIITERDIVRAVADGCDLYETEVSEYMTEAPIVSDQDATIADAITKMDAAGIRHLVVTSGEDAVGVVSVRDLVGVLAPVVEALEA